tara:strand:+ start:5067 stop:6050 length:984 start_codon:yes stop_codon:yes gene_type:complete
MQFVLFPDVETDPSPYPGDSVDDAVVWYDAEAPEQSLIIATLKASNQRPVLPTGILTYDLQGNQKQVLMGGTPNNIDLRPGFPFEEERAPLIAASHWYSGKVGLYQMGADRMLRQLNLFESGVEKLRGICMGKLKDKFYYFAVGSTGTIERYRIASVNQVVLEDRWQLKSEAEGCVVDEPGNRVYIAEENTGIWYIPLSSTPKIKSEPELLDKVSFFRPLARGIEGLAILEDTGKRYLVASVQEKSRFAIYDLATDQYIATFRINAGNEIDGVSKTDGVEIFNKPLGPQFPQGVMVVHDDNNEPKLNQNFKYVSLEALRNMLKEAPQ